MHAIRYFKRYRMEVDLAAAPPPAPLPSGYRWLAWADAALDTHGVLLSCAFRDEIDAQLFRSFGSLAGCTQLMRAIRSRAGFLPAATWMVVADDGPCGTVQGVREPRGRGAVQNLGVDPAHRGHGLGEALLLQALEGFRRGGLSVATLEVTASNDAAIRLYRRAGFRCRKTVYKMVQVPADELPASAATWSLVP